MNKMAEAFGDIRAEGKLKTDTLIFLQAKMEKKVKKNAYIIWIPVATSLLLVIGFYSRLYFTETTYIGLDINPAIELSLNRFDRVIDVYAYNEDGAKLIENLNLNHKAYIDAVSEVVKFTVLNGLIQKDGLVAITLQSNDKTKEAKLMQNIKTSTENTVYAHHNQSQVDVFSISGDVRNNSYELNISPAKYLAILELQAANPSITVESCRGHTISDIKKLHHDIYSNPETNATPQFNNRHHNSHRKRSQH